MKNKTTSETQAKFAKGQKVRSRFPGVAPWSDELQPVGDLRSLSDLCEALAQASDELAGCVGGHEQGESRQRVLIREALHRVTELMSELHGDAERGSGPDAFPPMLRNKSGKFSDVG